MSNRREGRDTAFDFVNIQHERPDFVVDQNLEAVRGQSGVKVFFLKPFKPLLRKIIKKTGAPETHTAIEEPEDSEKD